MSQQPVSAIYGPLEQEPALTTHQSRLPVEGEQLDLGHAAQQISEEKELQTRGERLATDHFQALSDANARREYLIKTAEHAGKVRELGSFMTTTQAEPKNRKAVEGGQLLAKRRMAKTLSRACGVCALSKTCSIENKPGKWLEYHPYSKTAGRLPKSRVPRTESRDNFLKRLKEDPLAHCIPPKK